MKYIHVILFCAFIMPLVSCQTLDGMLDDFQTINNGDIPPPAVAAGDSSQRLLNENPCPQVILVDDLSSISDFTSPNKPKKDDLISRVDLTSAESTCRISANTATVDLKLIFKGLLGPKAKQKSSDKPFFTYPYFVAITAPNGKIMAKEIFAASLSYDAHETTHDYFENLRQIIPIKNKDQAHLYKVMIGFQVSPDQLAYNRANMVPIAKK